MFVRNKIYWYSSRLNPSFPSLSTAAAAGSGTAPTLVPFYLRRVSTPSASPSEPPPPHRIPPSSSFRYRRKPTHPDIVPANPPNPPTKRHGSHGGSYGINKSGAHAPQLPSLLPSAATSLFAFPSPRPTTSLPFQPTLLSRSFSRRCPLLYLALSLPLSSLFPAFPPHHQRAPGSLSPLLWISFFPLNLRLWIAPTSISPSLLPPSFLMYPSFLKLRLKLYNEHALYRVTRNIYIIFFHYFFHYVEVV